MFSSIFLMPDDWDITVDAAGNIALAEAPWAIAQDVASACKLWRGEDRYDTTKGIPYKESILGYLPSPQLLSEWYRREAKTVPDVKEANIVLQYDRNSRNLSGQIQLKLTDGQTTNVNF